MHLLCIIEHVVLCIMIYIDILNKDQMYRLIYIDLCQLIYDGTLIY